MNNNNNNNKNNTCNPIVGDYILASNIDNVDSTIVDPNLINPWGIVIQDDYIWTAINGKDMIIRNDMDGHNPFNILFYDEVGNLLSNSLFPAVNPTGIIINPDFGYFVTDGTNTRKSMFLISAQSGDIFGYNKYVGGGRKAYRLYKGSSTNTVPSYTGLAINECHLFAADFLNGKVDVFNDIHKANQIEYNTSIRQYRLMGPNYEAPYNIVYLNRVLYFIYAYKTSANTVVDSNLGGFIDICSKNGVFIRRFNLSSDTELKSPWGISLVPKSYIQNRCINRCVGKNCCNNTCCKNKDAEILVSNNGSGIINVYDKCGNRTGQIYSSDTKTILSTEGLRGIVSYRERIYFAAGPDSGINGRFGYMYSSALDYI